MGQGTEVIFSGIRQQRSRRGRCGDVVVTEIEPLQRTGTKMVQQRPPAGVDPKLPCSPMRQADPELVSQPSQANFVNRVFAHHALGRRQPGQFVGQIRQGDGRRLESTRGQFQPGQADPISRRSHPGDVVVGPGIQQRRIGQRSGRHRLGHLPPHHPLGRLGVLHLIADRHPISRPNQLLQVAVQRVVRKPCHRNRVVGILVATGQSQPQHRGHHFRVLEEQLVEIPHPEQQHGLRILPFDLGIPLHHRGQLGGTPLGGFRTGLAVGCSVSVLRQPSWLTGVL